ncbi:MAG: flagellar motor stator protein MotA [Alphaproteobacteria bacterium]|nr:flagellar motor stator protein MotA [Alphaproteobacteria bacterium]
MFQIIGLIGVFGAIAAGYMLEGGKFGAILHAVGPELLIILGSGLMTMLLSNEFATIKKLLGKFAKVISGPAWQKGDYVDALCLLFLLIRVARQEGNMALEKHIENPDTSVVFSRYPKLCKDHHLVAFITDVFRSITMNFTDPHMVGDMMETELDKHHREELSAAKALSSVADALPALGIVAAVLGVIKAMGAISESPEVLGEMIGSALVGTFLGVLLAYGVVGPIAGRIKGVIEEEGLMMGMVRQVIMAHLEGLGPQLAVEVGRRSVPTRFQPSFSELDEVVGETSKNVRTKAE